MCDMPVPLHHKSHQQLPQTRLQSLLNLQAMKKPLSHLQTMTHMPRVAANVAIETPLLVNADALRKFVAVGTVSRVGFPRGRGCGITPLLSTRHGCMLLPLNHRFLAAMRGEGGNTATLKTFFSTMTRKRYYRIHTSVPPNPQTYIPPGGMHVVVVGRAQAPPPWEPPRG